MMDMRLMADNVTMKAKEQNLTSIEKNYKASEPVP